MLKSKVTKLKQKKTPDVNIESIVEEYNNILAQEKLLSKRKKELADAIKDFAVSNGDQDAKGSHYYETGNDYVIGNLASHSISLNTEKAKELCVSKGIYKDVVKISESIDEDKLEKYVGDTISYEELQSVTNIKDTYRVLVKKKEVPSDMPVVQQMAASKKRTLIKPRK